MVNIAIVDGETAICGGLSWSELDRLGKVRYYPRTSQSELAERVEDAEVVLTNKVAFPRDLLKGLTKLKYIGVTATGYNIVDVTSARELGITVTNVPAYSADSVAQQVFGHILDYYSKVAEYSQLVKSGQWSKSPDFCLLSFPIMELAAKKIGILGCGAIGERVARIAESFGMTVLKAALPSRNTANRIPLAEVLAQSDVVSLHCPLTSETEKIVNKEFLEQMKSNAILINTSRGGLIDETALDTQLRLRKIAHASLDVLSTEPPEISNPLIANPYVTLTPHIAWGTLEARARLICEVKENLAAFLRGENRNCVN